MKRVYKYRGEVILPNDNGTWWITDYYDMEFDTLDEAKNCVDKRQGCWSGKCMPLRWLKDEILKEYYEGIKYF